MQKKHSIVRSDEEIKKFIVEELERKKTIDASTVTVDVKNGRVTLTGEVPDASAQSSANWITTAIPGVTDVINHLTVRRPATLTMPDNKQKSQ